MYVLRTPSVHHNTTRPYSTANGSGESSGFGRGPPAHPCHVPFHCVVPSRTDREKTRVLPRAIVVCRRRKQYPFTACDTYSQANTTIRTIVCTVRLLRRLYDISTALFVHHCIHSRPASRSPRRRFVTQRRHSTNRLLVLKSLQWPDCVCHVTGIAPSAQGSNLISPGIFPPRPGPPQSRSDIQHAAANIRLDLAV